MSNLLWKSLMVSPAFLGATLLASNATLAAPIIATKAQPNTAPNVIVPQKTEVIADATTSNQKVLDQVNNYTNESNNQSQVTSVSQFSDVQPTDWAFQSLQSLVERYGCIAGYPNSTYRGNRALSRYEFAAGLNACLNRVNELIATATADLVTKQDLATLQRLQEEFAAELATLRGRVDSLEARTSFLETHQFSTTTKLQGEAVFAGTDAFGGNSGQANHTAFQDRVRLGLVTSFTGQDLLTTRLAAGNANTLSLVDRNGTAINANGKDAEGLQTFALNGQSISNSVSIDRLTYESPIGPARIYIAASGGEHSQYAAVNNPYFFDNSDGGNGALSTFASENPIYRIGGGSGAGLNFALGKPGGKLKSTSITLGYLASEANSTAPGAGLFNGNYAALGQLNLGLGDRIALAATYVHGYNGAGGSLFDQGGAFGTDLPVVGTAAANSLGANGGGASFNNSYGLSVAVKPSNKVSLSGFVSYSNVKSFGLNDNYEAWSYGAGLALPDFGKKGNVLGIFGGAEPYALNRTGFANTGSVPYHIEGFYKYKVSDNVSITPGVIWLTSPGGSNNADDAFIGTLRTTFTF